MFFLLKYHNDTTTTDCQHETAVIRLDTQRNKLQKLAMLSQHNDPWHIIEVTYLLTTSETITSFSKKNN